jgi:hypothetical protein
MDGLGNVFREMFGGLFEVAGEGAIEGTAYATAEGVADGMRPEVQPTEMTRYLAGGPRTLNINDR